MLALACVTGAVTFVGLEFWPNFDAPTFRGFVVPAGVADGLEVRWARAYAKIEFPDSGWRPIHLTLQLREAEPAVPPGASVTLLVDDVPLRQVVVAPGWHDYEVTITRPAAVPAGRLALQLVSPTVEGRDASIGVGRVQTRVALTSARGAAWGTVGALLGGLLWLAFAVRAGEIAVPASWRRARFADLPSAGPVLAAIAVFGVLIGTLGYAQLGARLFAVVWWIPQALGLDSALPWVRTLATAPATLFHVVVIVAMMTLPGWFVLSSYPRARPGDGDHDALLAMPITVALIGAAFVPLQWAGVGNLGFTVVVLVAYGGLAGILAANREKRGALVLFVRANQLFFLLQVLVPLCALFYLTVGLHDSSQIVDWTWAARRNLHTLPNDNELSWLASLTWRRHLPADSLFSGLWRISDRGPLLAVVHSFLYRALDPGVEYFPHYLRLGIVLNGAFASAIFALVRQWSSSRVAWGCAALVALNPWNFLNVYYTWPKLFGAYFLIAAMVVSWNATRPTLGHFVWCGALFGLGALAHAGNLLSFPVFFLFTIAMYARSATSWVHLASMPIVLGITQIPWIVYTRL